MFWFQLISPLPFNYFLCDIITMKVLFKFCFICVCVIRKISASEQLNLNNLLANVPKVVSPSDDETTNKTERQEDYLPIIEAEDYDYNNKDIVIENDEYDEGYSQKKKDESPLVKDVNIDKEKLTDFNTQTPIKIETATKEINDKERSPIAKIELRINKIPQKLSRIKSVEEDNDKEIEPEENEDNTKTTKKINRKHRNQLEPKTKIKSKNFKLNDDTSKNNSQTNQEDSFPSSISEKEENTHQQAEKLPDSKIIHIQMNTNQKDDAQLEKSVNEIDERHLQVFNESEQEIKQKNDTLRETEENRKAENVKQIDTKDKVAVNDIDAQLRTTDNEEVNNKQTTNKTVVEFETDEGKLGKEAKLSSIMSTTENIKSMSIENTEEKLHHQLLEEPVVQNLNDSNSKTSKTRTKTSSLEEQNSFKPDVVTESQIKDSNSNSSSNATVAPKLQDKFETLSYQVLEKPIVQNSSSDLNQFEPVQKSLRSSHTFETITATPAELASRADSEETYTTPKRIKKLIKFAVIGDKGNVEEKEKQSVGQQKSITSKETMDIGQPESKLHLRTNERTIESIPDKIDNPTRRKTHLASKIFSNKLKLVRGIQMRQDNTTVPRVKEDTTNAQNKLKEIEKHIDSHSFIINDIQNDISFLLNDIKEIRNKFKKEEKLFESTMDLEKLDAEKFNKQVENLEADVKSMDEKIRVYYKNISYVEMQLTQVKEDVNSISDIQTSLDNLVRRLDVIENQTKSASNLESGINQSGDTPNTIDDQQMRNLNDKIEILNNKTDTEATNNIKLKADMTSMKESFETSVNEMKEDISALQRNLEDLSKQFETLKLDNVDEQDKDNWKHLMNEIDKSHNHNEAILMKNQKHLEEKLDKIAKSLKIKDENKTENKNVKENDNLRSLKLEKAITERKGPHHKSRSRKNRHHRKTIVAETDEAFKIVEIDLPPHLRKMGRHNGCKVVIKAKLIK